MGPLLGTNAGAAGLSWKAPHSGASPEPAGMSPPSKVGRGLGLVCIKVVESDWTAPCLEPVVLGLEGIVTTKLSPA